MATLHKLFQKIEKKGIPLNTFHEDRITDTKTRKEIMRSKLQNNTLHMQRFYIRF